MFLLTVEVAGDGPRPYVNVTTHVRIANVAKVAHSRILTNAAVLYLGVVAYVDIPLQERSRSEMTERPNMNGGFKVSAFQYGGYHLAIVPYNRIDHDGVGAQLTSFAHATGALYSGIRLDNGIASDLYRGVYVRGLRIHYGYALQHPLI